MKPAECHNRHNLSLPLSQPQNRLKSASGAACHNRHNLHASAHMRRAHASARMYARVRVHAGAPVGCDGCDVVTIQQQQGFQRHNLCHNLRKG